MGIYRSSMLDFYISYLFSFGSMFQRCQNPTKLTRAYLIIMPEPGLWAAAYSYSYLAARTHLPFLRSLDLCSTKSKDAPPPPHHLLLSSRNRMHLVAAATTHMLLMSAPRRVLVFWYVFGLDALLQLACITYYIYMCVCGSRLLFQEPEKLAK